MGADVTDLVSQSPLPRRHGVVGTERITRAWRDDRRYLLAVAARILNDMAEAEDVVQDAFARLTVQRVEEIDDLRAWLVVVVRRIALDRLGSAHRRLVVTTERVPEGAPGADPADRVTLDEDVRRALGVVLDRLSPGERTAFLLHDVFGVPFARVAELTGRTPAACRQLASRARRGIHRGDPSGDQPVTPPHLTAVAERFVAACASGDVEGLARVLTPDVAGWATLDLGCVHFASGVDAVSQRLLFFLGPRSGVQLTTIPLHDEVAVLATRRADPVVIARLEVAGDRVRAIRTVLVSG